MFCLNRRLWLAIQIFVCLFICKSSPMMHCGNRSFREVTWQMFGKQSKWKSNGGIIGSKAKSCCNGVQHHFLRIRWLWMNRKTIGEAIYIRVSNRKYNLIATQRGNVPTKSWRGKSAVFLMYKSLTSHGSSKKKPSYGRGISDYNLPNLQELWVSFRMICTKVYPWYANTCQR